MLSAGFVFPAAVGVITESNAEKAIEELKAYEASALVFSRCHRPQKHPQIGVVMPTDVHLYANVCLQCQARRPQKRAGSSTLPCSGSTCVACFD